MKSSITRVPVSVKSGCVSRQRQKISRDPPEIQVSQRSGICNLVNSQVLDEPSRAERHIFTGNTDFEIFSYMYRFASLESNLLLFVIF